MTNSPMHIIFPGKLMVGNGSFAQLPGELLQWQPRKVLLATIEPLLANIQPLKAALEAAQVEVLINDFKSPLRSQSTIYDAQTGNGFILKQSGNEKYLLELVGANWKKYHKKYDGVVFAKEETMKQIAGYNCKKATGKMADGSTVVAYYCPDLTVMATGFDPLFGSLSGIVLEYEISNPNGVTVNYQAQSVQMTMVNAAQFEMPKSGVKVLTFEQ